jgi:hypothetical protein
MIILDTNVLSALMLRTPDEAVGRWLNKHSPSALWLTVVTVYEIKTGIELLPLGNKRRFLETQLEEILQRFRNRILDWDLPASLLTAELHTQRKKKGQNVEMRDTMIAGIALTHRATLATRNGKDFKDTGVKLVSPWE